MSDLSLSDVAAVTNGENGFGGNGAWAMIILFALIFGGGGFGGWGNNRGNVATTADVQRATDFAALERQNNEGVAASRQAAYDVTTAVKDGNYNLLGEVRTLENNVTAGMSNLANAHTEILRAVDSAKYDAAMNTAGINANTTAQNQKVIDAIAAGNQKILDVMTGNRMADMQQQINQLQMQNAMAGVVRYPNGWTYNAGTSPFCNCGGCNGMT